MAENLFTLVRRWWAGTEGCRHFIVDGGQSFDCVETGDHEEHRAGGWVWAVASIPVREDPE